MDKIMETFEQMVRRLHTKMPMATQEDAIAFATRIKEELCNGQEPVAVVDENDEGENFDTLARISKEELAASQAREQQLREALALYAAERHTGNHAKEALALPHDDTCLRRYGAKLLRDAANEATRVAQYVPSIEGWLRRMADELEKK
jgi:hypothetical protein